MIGVLLGLPKFIYLNGLALLRAALSEFETAILAVIGVLLGFAFGPLIGASVALTIYIVLKQVSALVGGLIRSHRYHADRVEFLALVIRDNRHYDVKVNGE